MWHSSERNDGLDLSSKDTTPFLVHHCTFAKKRNAVGAACADKEHVTVVIFLVGDAAVNNIGHEFHNRERP